MASRTIKGIKIYVKISSNIHPDIEKRKMKNQIYQNLRFISLRNDAAVISAIDSLDIVPAKSICIKRERGKMIIKIKYC